MNASGAVSSTSRVRASERSSSWARSLKRRNSEEIRRPASSGVPTASNQRTIALSGSWIASTIAYETADDRHVGERLDQAGRSRTRRAPPTCRAAGRASTGPRSSSRGSRSGRRRRAPRGCASRGRARRSTQTTAATTIAADASSTSARSFTSSECGNTSVSSPRSAPAAEQIGDRASLDADVEELRQRPHRRKPRKRCRRLAPRGARAPRGIRPRAA